MSVKFSADLATENSHETRWARQLRTAVLEQLSVVPKAFPLAPENGEFIEEIRRMNVGRYRVLFTIKGRRIHILHVRGAYFGTPESHDDGVVFAV